MRKNRKEFIVMYIIPKERVNVKNMFNDIIKKKKEKNIGRERNE